MTENTNDNDKAPVEALFRGPDSHGQAAMLLVESLIHGLIAHSVITLEEAIEIVEVASEVKKEVAADLGDSPATMRKSLSILSSISSSLKQDIQDR